MDLYKKVLHLIEGEEQHREKWKSLAGVEAVREWKTFGPERWIKRPHNRRDIYALECLAVVLFAVRETFDCDRERKIVNAWAAELRNAASAGVVKARDPDTLLPLTKLPDGWEWRLSLEDADTWVTGNGMEWKCSKVVDYLYREFFETNKVEVGSVSSIATAAAKTTKLKSYVETAVGMAAAVGSVALKLQAENKKITAQGLRDGLTALKDDIDVLQGGARFQLKKNSKFALLANSRQMDIASTTIVAFNTKIQNLLKQD